MEMGTIRKCPLIEATLVYKHLPVPTCRYR